MPRRRWIAVVLVAAVVAGTAVLAARRPNLDGDTDDASQRRAEATPVDRPPPRAGTTSLPLRAGQFVPFACEDALPGLTFFDPLYVAPLPDGSGRLAVVERRGTIQLVSQTAGESGKNFQKKLLVDISAKVQLTKDQAEEGLLGLAFHPRFAHADSPHRGEFFVYYVARGSSPAESTNRLSRMRMKPGRLDEVDAEFESILIDQPQLHQAHNGGSLLFGPDGFLYLSLGDDDMPAPHSNAQTISHNLFSGILRLDVDRRGGDTSHPPPRGPVVGRTDGYFIPNDNPFVGRPGALEEFYAIGLRNPWRISFDRKTGVLYASDVGARRREEINVIAAGSNCGWDYLEGTLPRRNFEADAPERPHDYIGVETPPLHEYPRDAAHRCVIGGYVYRGKQFPELVGRYIYADQSGRVYALELADNGRRAAANRLIAVLPEPGIGISSLGEDGQGELYFCAIGDLATETGRVFRLRRTRDYERDFLPNELSAAGLFADWQALRPGIGVIPYDINVPFWSDGADKRRWIAVPPDEQVTVDPHGALRFPPGTVFVKHFDLPIDQRGQTPPRPLETRVLVCDDSGGVYGATYRWSSDGRRARLVTFNETETFAIVQKDGTNTTQTWTYPGRFECAICHNDASGQVLGFSLRQLDRNVAAEAGKHENQIKRLVAAGVLSHAATSVPPQLIGRLARLDDDSAPLEHRVRSYLDVNCSSCHNPHTRFAAFDARLARDIGEQGLIDGMSYHHKEKGLRARIVLPGDLDMSMLYYRISASDPCLRMPPLGTAVVDRQAEQAVAAWIRSLPPTAPAAEPSPQTAAGQSAPPR